MNGTISRGMEAIVESEGNVGKENSEESSDYESKTISTTVNATCTALRGEECGEGDEVRSSTIVEEG